MDNATPQSNPLRQYFRTFKMYLRLPSGTSYYPDGTVEFTEGGEVGILPMTGKDELALKNPDSLLNGEAMVEVLTSCVPAVKNPRKLLTNDIDALITAIRYATFNDTLETTINCPSCGTENVFKLNLQYALDNMQELEPEYVVNLENGLSIFVKPYPFTSVMKALHSQFERNKLSRAIDSDSLNDEARAAMFSTAFKNLSVTKFELISNSVVKIVDESNNINVSDRKYILEFLQNTDKKTVDKIDDLISEINKVGIKRTFRAKCQKCNHEWESEIDFNPVNFS